MDFINFKIVKMSMYHCIALVLILKAKYLTGIKRGIISVYMFPASNVCSGGLSDIGSHPHFMTKGRGDSTNSLETHVNLVQRLNKQSDIYLQNGQICKFKIKRTYASTFPPTPEQILVTVLSIKPFHLFHQNYLTPPSEFGINSFESWIPARRPFQTS